MLNNKLAVELHFLADAFPGSSSGSLDLASLKGPYPDLYARAVVGYARAIDACFIVGIPFAAVCFVAACCMQPLPLREELEKAAAGAPGEGALPIVDAVPAATAAAAAGAASESPSSPGATAERADASTTVTASDVEVATGAEGGSSGSVESAAAGPSGGGLLPTSAAPALVES